jgi:hypothetical protein
MAMTRSGAVWFFSESPAALVALHNASPRGTARCRAMWGAEQCAWKHGKLRAGSDVAQGKEQLFSGLVEHVTRVKPSMWFGSPDDTQHWLHLHLVDSLGLVRFHGFASPGGLKPDGIRVNRPRHSFPPRGRSRAQHLLGISSTSREGMFRSTAE